MNEDLVKRMVADIPIFSYGEVDSTQNIARDLVDSDALGYGPIRAVISAKHQTKGRGRLDRSWESNADSSLLTTFIVKNDGDNSFYKISSILISLCEYLETKNINVNIKWPNDIVFETNDGYLKLAGCLTEVYGKYLLIGVGINLRPDAYLGIEGCTSISELGIDVGFDGLLSNLTSFASKNISLDSSGIKTKYEKYCSTISKNVRVERTNGMLEGIATGINNNGNLIIEEQGIVHTISEGDIIHLRLNS
ncbi:MAG: biotin--[acetyl-CoA-carboxylase] ligase [Acidimicrobiia bacterium]